jgi:hypothetical protein
MGRMDMVLDKGPHVRRLLERLAPTSMFSFRIWSPNQFFQ